MDELDVSLVPEGFRADVMKAFEKGNPHGILWTFDNTLGLKFVFDNRWVLMSKGIYEPMLVRAFQNTRTNWSEWSLKNLEFMFRLGDRQKIRDSGDKIPNGKSFTLYRGVAGKHPRRKVSGMSWTRSVERARWFATRLPGLHDPAVYVTTVLADEVFCYLAGRSEEEFVARAKQTRRLNVED